MKTLRKVLEAEISKMRLLLFVLIFGLTFFPGCGGTDPGNNIGQDTDAVVDNTTDGSDPTLPDSLLPEPDGSDPSLCEDGYIFISELHGCYETPCCDLAGEWIDSYDNDVVNVTMDKPYKAIVEGLTTLYIDGRSVTSNDEEGGISGSISEDGNTLDLVMVNPYSGSTTEFTLTKK